MHLAGFLEQLGILVSCFVHERRHKLIERFLEGRRAQQSFELGLMEECTLQHLEVLKSAWLKDGIVNPTTPKKALPLPSATVQSEASPGGPVIVLKRPYN